MRGSDLTPLRGNVLVKPDETVSVTGSGLFIPDTAAVAPSMSGTVIRVSDLDYRLLRARVATVAHCLWLLDAQESTHACCAQLREAMADYMRGLATDADLASVKVGDRVVFPMESGHQLVVGEDLDESVLVIPQDALLAIVPEQSVIEGVL